MTPQDFIKELINNGFKKTDKFFPTGDEQEYIKIVKHDQNLSVVEHINIIVNFKKQYYYFRDLLTGDSFATNNINILLRMYDSNL